MDLSMDLWHSNNMKIILRNFAKDHCFWTLWTLNYGDCIPFSCIDYFHMAHNQVKQWKTWSNLHLCGRGPIISVLFICLSTSLFVCFWRIFLRIYLVDFLKFFAWGYFAIYSTKWQSNNLENCICCQDKCFGILRRVALLFVL